MATEDRDEEVDRLLHDAEHADRGATMALMMRDTEAAERFRQKRERLLADALRRDPARVAPAWEECMLEVPTPTKGA